MLLYQVLYKWLTECSKTPQNALLSSPSHNNMRKTGSVRNRQVSGSSPLVGSILSILTSHFTAPSIHCDVSCAGRWLHGSNPVPRIAEQITLAFNLAIDKDVVRRILAHHHWPRQSPGGPSWLTFLGHVKESLWSMDLFRCESLTLRTHWVLVVMDQYTRRIIGFGVHAGTVDGVGLCRMFNRAIPGQRWLPKYLSSDHDPLYKFHQWQANLRILEVTEIKT